MSYIDDSLSQGETVVALFPQHWITRLLLVLWIVLAFVTFGASLILAIYEYFRLRCVEHGVTNKRVIYKSGIISRHTDEMKISSIETVEIDQSILGRILDYGDIKVTGRGTSYVILHDVINPMGVKREIESISNPAP